MKKVILLSMLVLIGINSFSQAPYKFKYQAVIRDASGVLKSNQGVDLLISILSGSENGEIVYSEEHRGLKTNAYGLVNLNVGDGTSKLGELEKLNWGNNSYYLFIEIRNGTTWVSLGSSQLLSVPYAMYANKSNTVEKPEEYTAGNGMSLSSTKVFSNTAPDQEVNIAEGNGIAATGNYPNFTITNSLPNANHSGDATGATALTVTGFQGRPVVADVPAINNVYKYDGDKWALANGVYTAGHGIAVDPTTNIISNIATDTIKAGAGIAVTGKYPTYTVTNTNQNATHTGDVTGSKNITVRKIQGFPVDSVAPKEGQIMRFKSGRWVPDSVSEYSFAISPYHCYPLDMYSRCSLSRQTGTVIIQGTGTICIMIDVPIIINGVNKKIKSVKFNCFVSPSDTIYRIGIYTFNRNIKKTIFIDDTDRSPISTSSSFEIKPTTPTLIDGHLELWLDMKGWLYVNNIYITLQD